jgi:hypothetical protein
MDSVLKVLQKLLGGGGHGMVVMCDVTEPWKGNHAMTKPQATPERWDGKAVLTSDADGFPALLQTVMQEVLEALQAEKGERTPARLGHRSGITSASW